MPRRNRGRCDSGRCLGIRVLAVALSLTALACASSPEGEAVPEGAAPAIPVQYEMRRVARSSDSCESPDRGCATITLEYPEFTSAPSEATRQSLDDFVRQSLLAPKFSDEGADSVDELVRRFLAEYDQVSTSSEDYWAPWNREIQISVYHEDPRVLSFRVSEQEYTGGAHPIWTVTYASYDLVTGERLALSDLFLEGSRASLDALGEQRFRAVREIPPEETLTSAGFRFEGGRFSLTDNFAVVESGLIFRWDPYEVAPYAVGPTEIALGFAELRDYIRPDGPLAARL